VYANHLINAKLSNIYNILAVPGLDRSYRYVQPVQVVIVTAVAGAVLLLLARRGRSLGAVALVALFVVSSSWTRHDAMQATARSAYGKTLHDRVDLPGLRPGEDVAYDLSSYTIEGLWLFQWQQPEARFRLFTSAKGQIPRTRLVISGKRWSQAVPLQARLVWSDPARDQAVWELPSPSR
jgi:hypothetical protein